MDWLKRQPAFGPQHDEIIVANYKSWGERTVRTNVSCACNAARKGYLPKFSVPIGELLMSVGDIEVDLGSDLLPF